MKTFLIRAGLVALCVVAAYIFAFAGLAIRFEDALPQSQAFGMAVALFAAVPTALAFFAAFAKVSR